MVIDGINKAVVEEKLDSLMTLLRSSCLKLSTPLHKEESHLYMRMLKKTLVVKESQNLWYDDIIETVDIVNDESVKVKELTDALVQLNLSLLNKKLDDFWKALSSPILMTTGVIEGSCKDVYFQMFSKALKKRGHYSCPWIVCHTDAGNTVYIDVETYSYSWMTPKDFVPHARYLTRKDVHAIIEKTNKHHINKYKQMILEKSIVKIQACCRGYLLRKRLITRLKYFKQNEKYIVKIQAWWRKVVAEKKYGTLIKMKAIEARLRRERKQNPMAWYKIQVCTISIYHKPN